jgi:hypothetical protein
MAGTPYFWAISIACAVLIAIATISPVRQRRLALFSGLLQMPAGALALTFGEYWTPETMWSLKPGIEDFMFNFAAGLMVWLLVAPWPATRRIERTGTKAQLAGRIALLYVLITSFYLSLLSTGHDPMSASILAMAAALAVMLALRPTLWPLCLPAAFLYPLGHGSALAIGLRLWPDLTRHWPQGAFWSWPAWFGTPLGELAWACLFGASAPLMAVLVLEGHRRG